MLGLAQAVAQVVVSARNLTTGEISAYGTSALVPAGWETLPPGLQLPQCSWWQTPRFRDPSVSRAAVVESDVVCSIIPWFLPVGALIAALVAWKVLS
jgi:hypothetical protein